MINLVLGSRFYFRLFSGCPGNSVHMFRSGAGGKVVLYSLYSLAVKIRLSFERYLSVVLETSWVSFSTRDFNVKILLQLSNFPTKTCTNPREHFFFFVPQCHAEKGSSIKFQSNTESVISIILRSGVWSLYATIFGP